MEPEKEGMVAPCLGKKRAMIKTVTFNIGGQRFEVSKSLLDMHPNTILAKMSSKQWQEDPEEEIFVERNGNIFEFILAYLRDGRVDLPITTSKEMVISELMYYGVDFEKGNICDRTSQKAYCFHSLDLVMKDLKDAANKSELEYRCIQLAIDITQKYMSAKTPFWEREGFYFTIKNDNMKALRNLGNSDVVSEKTSVHLRQLGFKLTSFNVWTSCMTLRKEDPAVGNE